MVHRRKTAIVLASVVLLAMTGVALAASGLDTFEDGNVNGWSAGNISSDTYNGTYSLETNQQTYWDSGPSLSDTANVTTLVRPNGGSMAIAVQAASDQRQRLVLHAVDDYLLINSKIPGDDNFASVSYTVNESDWYIVQIYNSGSNVCARSKRPSESDWSANVCVNRLYTGDGNTLKVTGGYGNNNYYDSVSANQPLTPVPTYNVSGEVTDEETNDQIQDVSVEVYNDSGGLAGSDTTNDVGQYDVGGLENGTYTMWVNKTGYQNENRTITVDGDDQIQNFALASFNASIELRTKRYIPHGQTAPYTVIVTQDGDRMEVTSDATVTSSNTSVVTVDSNAFEIIATSDITVNERITLTATWTDSNGNQYVATKNVTVANATVANIGILPTWTRVGASVGDKTLQLIIVATMIGAGAAALASSFAGLSASTGIVVLGWFAGYTSDGILIVSFMFAIFVGLNLSNNTTIMSRPGG